MGDKVSPQNGGRALFSIDNKGVAVAVPPFCGGVVATPVLESGLIRHHLHAGIDKQNVAGDAAAQIAGQENGGVGDFRGVRVTA